MQKCEEIPPFITMQLWTSVRVFTTLNLGSPNLLRPCLGFRNVTWPPRSSPPPPPPSRLTADEMARVDDLNDGSLLTVASPPVISSSEQHQRPPDSCTRSLTPDVPHNCRVHMETAEGCWNIHGFPSSRHFLNHYSANLGRQMERLLNGADLWQVTHLVKKRKGRTWKVTDGAFCLSPRSKVLLSPIGPAWGFRSGREATIAAMLRAQDGLQKSAWK